MKNTALQKWLAGIVSMTLILSVTILPGMAVSDEDIGKTTSAGSELVSDPAEGTAYAAVSTPKQKSMQGFSAPQTETASSPADSTAAQSGEAVSLAGEPAADTDGEEYTSVQDAVNAAKSGSTVTLLRDTAENISIPEGQDITLDLNGCTLTAAESGLSVITVDAEGTLTLDDAAGGGSVSGGNAERGGGVFNEGTFIIAGGAVCGNTAELYGGGVCNDGTFTMTGGEIRDNASDYLGGGVFNIAVFILDGGTISGNEAESGGGLCSINTGENIECSIRSGVISDNSADDGGGVYVEDSTFTISGGTISGNRAGGIYGGGGVFVAEYYESASFEMTGGAVTGNTAEADGGGVVVQDCAFSMTGGEISDNTALNGGGVLGDYSDLSVSGGRISSNCAEFGGGIFFFSEEESLDLAIGGGEISGNKAAAEDDSDTGDGFGGGVFMIGGCASMSGGSISGNTAAYAGGIYVSHSASFDMTDGSVAGNKAELYGGGVENSYDSSFTMAGGSISGNEAEYGGGVANIHMEPDYPEEVAYTDTFEMTGGSITDNTADYAGGGVYSEAAFTLDGGTIEENDADMFGGGVCFRTHREEDTFTMTSGVVRANTAGYSGGGVYIQGDEDQDNADARIRGGEITGNTAAEFGGGVEGLYGSLVISGGTISGNETEFNGGGVYVEDMDLTLSGGTISGNSAEFGGGVCFLCVKDEYVFHFSAGEIHDNTASECGGGICCDYDTTLNMTGGTVTGNTSGFAGGGVYSGYDSTFTMTGGQITGNTAAKYGGGVENGYDGTFTMAGGTISGNSADLGGGVANIHMEEEYPDDVEENTAFEMTGGTISGNSASHGGGVYNDAAFTMTDGALYGNTAETCGADVDNTDGGTLTLIPAVDMDVSGYTVLGWYEDGADGRYADADNPNEVSEINGLTADIALVAAYGYTITYSVSGDTTLVDPAFINVTKGEGTVAASGEGLPVPEGLCCFDSWNTEADGSGDSYEAGETLSFDGDTTLYAQFAEHIWDDGVVTKEPTANEDGIMTYTCIVCGATKEESIPATGDNGDDDNNKKDNPVVTSNPEDTGNTGNTGYTGSGSGTATSPQTDGPAAPEMTALWIMAAVLAAAGGVMLLLYRETGRRKGRRIF